MLELEIDGKALQVAEGSMVIDAARQAGLYIPHFCYHKKLSIAANCRMCLIQVEKAPKPLPACATPVTNGMKVFTHSDLAVKAQRGVMEFLLINHPLDCPICDQGGECQLQDLAVGYGGGSSRYQEEKRVVADKDLGPLIATDMTRCINCTRCVRFTQEIAGFMELGQAYRGDRAEIMPFVERTVTSELSGNVIDLCPVGALTSKPFRFKARTWELSRRRSISPHDSLGSNLIVQVKHDQVLRVLPLENEAINECWLSDKDRFSYEGLISPERLTRPMIKQGGVWQEVAWNVALDYCAHALRDIAAQQGPQALGALISPHATLEEMALAAKLMRGLGSDNIDFRLRQSDFSLDGARRGAPWLGMRIAEIAAIDRFLVIGAFLRQDQPLIAQRIRQAVKKGAQLNLLHVTDENPLCRVAAKAIVAPDALVGTLAEVVKAVAELKGQPLPGALAGDLAKVSPTETARSIAQSLVGGTQVAVLLGNHAGQHPRAGDLQRLAQALAGLLGARWGILGEAANSVGGHLAHALPQAGGLNAAAMLHEPREAYLLLGCEPELDCADGRAALSALRQAKTVIALTSFVSPLMREYADALLPVAPFTETSGSFVNTEGRLQSFEAVCRPAGETRPGWKVLRVLGNLCGLPGFAQRSSEDVRAELIPGSPEFIAGLDNTVSEEALAVTPAVATAALQRISDVPIYFADPLVRRAPALQKTLQAAPPKARVNRATLERLGLASASAVRLKQGDGEAVLDLAVDESVPEGCVRVAAGHAATASLGALFGRLVMERI